MSASRRPPALGLHDVQGNVLHPFGYGRGVHLFLHVDDEGSARSWLRDIAPTITDAVDWTGAKPASARNVSMTFAGLRAFGVDDRALKAFPSAFRAGMAGRSGVLGDHGACAPAQWDGGLGTGTAHVLVSLYADDVDAFDRELDDVRSSAERTGLDIVFEQRTAQLQGAREHFGFSDGFSQPTIAGVVPMPGADGVPDRNGRLRPLPVGEFIHGHPDVDGPRVATPPPPFHRNGTYQVWRKLAQDVEAFRAFCAERAAELDTSADTVAAKMIGRWQDGTPLALFPDKPGGESLDRDSVNNFCYGDDPRGEKCPLGAHVRRANPRDGLSFGGAMTARHRMIRRGMPYTDGDDRGLVFIAFMADIERQFEFVQQQWCNDGDAFGLGDDRDPIVGRRPAGSPLSAAEKMTIGGSPPRFLSPLREFVTTRGGEYLLTPSISALHALADGRE